MKIGLALSGGGVRATVFHLGVLKRIADSPRWQDITFVSTVSGGSLCIALVFEKAGQCWPTAQRFLADCLPEIRKLLTTCDLEGKYKRLVFTRPWLFLQGRASVIAKLMREHWGITSNVSQMPDPPRWEICATCYETGKNWSQFKERHPVLGKVVEFELYVRGVCHREEVEDGIGGAAEGDDEGDGVLE